MGQYQVMLTAAALAKICGVTVSEIERYTEQELLPVARKARWGTLYRPNAVDVIGFVRDLSRLGFAPGEIRLMVSLVELTGGGGSEVSAIIGERVKAIRAEIDTLAAFERDLSHFAERCSGDLNFLAAVATRPQQCGVLHA